VHRDYSGSLTAPDDEYFPSLDGKSMAGRLPKPRSQRKPTARCNAGQHWLLVQHGHGNAARCALILRGAFEHKSRGALLTNELFDFRLKDIDFLGNQSYAVQISGPPTVRVVEGIRRQIGCEE
jgi:hypothetical protein